MSAQPSEARFAQRSRSSRSALRSPTISASLSPWACASSAQAARRAEVRAAARCDSWPLTQP
eukprot:4296113-Alexandrium_andersonii.AAC.1